MGIMMCYPFTSKRLDKWGYPVYVQPKINGNRCRCEGLYDGTTCPPILRSSEANVIKSVPLINQVLRDLGIGWAEFDGELYSHGMKLQDIRSIVGRTVNLHPDHKRMEYHIFDIINDDPFKKRAAKLDTLRAETYREGVADKIKVVQTYRCLTDQELDRHIGGFLEGGYEGVIFRHPDGMYERRKSRWIMKYKPRKRGIFEVIGMTEEYDKDGFAKARLGALWCKTKEGVHFKVGTGFSAAERSVYYEDGTVIGQFINVKYQEWTKDRKPFHAVYAGFVKT